MYVTKAIYFIGIACLYVSTWSTDNSAGFIIEPNPAGFTGFMMVGFGGFYGFYVGFINLKVYHDSHNQLLPYSFSVLTVLV